MGMEVEKVKGVVENTPDMQETRTVASKEENISELLSNPIKEVKSDEKQTFETSLKDKNFFFEHPKLSLFGAGLLGLVLFSIGRNPKSLAKVLKGSSKALNPKYAQAEKTVDLVMQKVKSGGDAELTRSFEHAMKLFKKPEFRSDMHKALAGLEKDIAKYNVTVGDDVASAIAELKKNLNIYLDNYEKKLITGNASDWFESGKSFFEANKTLIDKINDFSNRNCVGRRVHEYDAVIRSFIRPCPKELLPQSGTYFHGTTKAKPIYKSGLSPFGSNQEMQRELGAGIYTTPDKRVAGGFSLPWGTILPLKLDNKAKVAFVDEVVHSRISSEADSVLFKYFGAKEIEEFSKITNDVPLVECMTRRLFLEAGYDAAYMPKAVKGGLFACFMPDVNKVLGRPQSQLVVFNGEKMEIIDRNLFQRVGDVGCKFATFGNMVKYSCALTRDVIKWFVKT